MATAINLNVNDNGFRASKLLVDGGGYFTKQLLLQKAVQGTINTLDEFLAEKPIRQTIKKLKRKYLIRTSQSNILYPRNRSPTNLDEWDITLVTLILNECFTLSPGENIAIQAIRDLRNSLYGHTAKVEMTDVEFQQNWTDIASTLTKHVTLLTNPNSIAFIQDMITRISKETLSADATIQTLKEWYEWGMEVEQRLEEIIEEQRALFSEAETKSEDRHRDTTDQLDNIQATQAHTAEDVSKILKVIKSENRPTVRGTKLKRKRSTYQLDNIQATQAHTAEDVSKILKVIKSENRPTVRGTKLKRKRSTYQRVHTRKPLGHSSDNVSLLLKRTMEHKEETVDIRELNRKIKQANLKLKAHTQDLEKFNIPCKTRMTEALTQQLKKYKIVVLKGIPGSGKSHLAKNVLNHFLSLNPDIDPLIMSNANETERVLDPDRSFVLLVDDMIGKISFEATEYKNWVQYIETFLSHVKVGKLYVVLTIRTAIFRQCNKKEMSDIFATENVVETDGYLLEHEKRDILELYRQYHGIDISSDQSDKIIQQQYVGIGFPLLCRMMIGHDVEEMFSRPSEYIKAEISPLASKDPLVFVILFMTLIGDSVLSKNELELSQGQKAGFKALQDYFKTSSMDMHKFYQKADMIEKTFLTYDENKNHFSFIHEAVAHSTFEVALEIQPGILIERCPFDSLIRNMNLIIESTNIELRPTNPYMLYRKHIVNRMIHVISADDVSNIKNVTSASIWKNKAFVDEIICKFDTRQLYLRDEKGMSLLVHFAGFGRIYALKVVVARLEKENQVQLAKHLQLALENACSSAEKECVDYLLTKVADINSQVVIAAVKGGNLEIVKAITDDFGIDKIETVKEENTDRTLLHIAAERGCGDLVSYLHHICPGLRNKIDENGNNAMHLSAKCVTKGAIECMKLCVDMGINPRVNNSDGESILSQAVLYSNIENVKYICDIYPELLHITDNNGNNALHNVACGGTAICMRFLVDLGLDPTEKNDTESTILHMAASAGNIATLKYIYDTYPNMLPVTDHEGYNALHYSALEGTVECVKFLIDKGIDPLHRCNKGQTVLHLLAACGNITTLSYISETYPNLIHATDDDGLNALHYASGDGTVECVKFLIDKGIDQGKKTDGGQTILHCSSDDGNLKTLNYICETYPDLLHATDDDGLNALHYASGEGTVECVKFLIDKGIDPGKKADGGLTILHFSADDGNLTTLKYIYETYPDLLQATDDDGLNALHYATGDGTVECVKFLIDKGINPGKKANGGQTILHCSAEDGNLTTLKYICETFPDLLQATDDDGLNALHYASGDGTVECVKFLIDKGIDPGKKADGGQTILHCSAEDGNLTTLKYICETFPDLLHLTDDDGLNALYYASGDGTVECVKFLIDKGIDPGKKADGGQTILHGSAEDGNLTTLKYICETFPDLVQVTDDDGLNALHYAAGDGTVECVQFLIEKGIDPGNKTDDEQTILHFSANSGNLITLKYICETYPDLLYATDDAGLNALHYAAGEGTVECVQFLVEKGIATGKKADGGQTILHFSANSRNLITLKYICETFPDLVQATDDDGLNALHYASGDGTVECVKS